MDNDLSAPLHVQALERFLDITRLLAEVEDVMVDPLPEIRYSWNVDEHENTDPDQILVDRDHKPEEKFIYDMSDLTEDTTWMKDILLSESSDSSDEEEMTKAEMKRMLQRHKYMKKIRDRTRHQPASYSGYSTSILGNPEKAYQFKAPSIDYSNKMRRSKRVVRKREKQLSASPLTITDMIGALASHCVAESSHPQLKIDPDEPPVKRPRSTSASGHLEVVWRAVAREAVLTAQKRRCVLETLQAKRMKICTEIRLRSDPTLAPATTGKPDGIGGNAMRGAEDGITGVEPILSKEHAPCQGQYLPEQQIQFEVQHKEQSEGQLRPKPQIQCQEDRHSEQHSVLPKEEPEEQPQPLQDDIKVHVPTPSTEDLHSP